MGVAASTVFGTALAVVAPATDAAAVGIGSDRTQISQLEQRIATQGAQAQSLVSRYDQAESRNAVIGRQIAADRARLAADHRAEARATARLQQVAIDAYMTDGPVNSLALTMFTGSANATTVMERSEYLHVAGAGLRTALDNWKSDQARTKASQSALRDEQMQAAATLRQLVATRQAAQASITMDQAMLSQVNGNLRSLLAVASAQRQAAAQRAAEQALAAVPVQHAPPQRVASVPSPPSRSAPSGYANPLRAVSSLAPARIDQGVDYGGFGPIYAIGDGVVLSTVNAGWPGGTFISYRLTNGAASGLVVYAAEDIYPAVQVGQTVFPDTVLGQMYEGPAGIETGWADSSGDGVTMAHTYGQFSGSNSTAFGYNFSQLLNSLGAPGGVLQNDPPTGNLPPGWPQW
ncbi:MAG: coiled-coil domain-containing protein [Acidimicrobiales bacterium]